MLTVLLTVLAVVLSAVPLTDPQQPPRDPARPGQAPVQISREAELQVKIADRTALPEAYVELSKLQEARGATQEAEATLLLARERGPEDRVPLQALAALYNRRGQFEKAIESLETAARLEPGDPVGYQLIAVFYWEKASKDTELAPVQKWTYIHEGISATDRALAVKPEYTDALTYKNILLRMRANLETDPAERQRTLAEADVLRNRAIELNRQRGLNPTMPVAAGRDGAPLPPPPPPPPSGTYDSGEAPVRVGGNIKIPAKLRHVPPEYPADAMQAGITGVVILEATIGSDGRVRSARVLKSIAPLDQAAVDAVTQWEFQPTLLNGRPVPVIMTVTVNFTLQ